MCQTTERTHLIHILTHARIRPSLLTGFALLDAAVTLLALYDVPLEPLHARVTRILADAEALRAASRRSLS